MPKIILIGERAVDITEKVSVTKINPESPSMVLVPHGMEVKSGMAENVWANLVSLGVPKEEIRFFSQETAIVKHRFVDEPSGYILFRLDKNDGVITENKEEFKEADYLEVEKLLNNGGVEAIVFSLYDKGYIESKWVTKIAQLAKDKGIPSFMDVKRKLGPWSLPITFVKINKKEYLFNCEGGAKPENFCGHLLVTMGGDGIKWVNKNKTYKGKRVNVANTCGAGDSTLAGFVVNYLETKDIKSAIKFANKVGAVAVSKHGTVAVKREEIT
jgi:bifunctional ADP-heptose synthase (sugar kinase/adenylyltransferase)